jgi:DNA-directed RNA polymerase I subunit RPA43
MTATLSSSQSKKRKHHPTEELSNVSPGEPQKKTEKRNKTVVQPGTAAVPPPQGKRANDKTGRTPKEHSNETSTNVLSDTTKSHKTKSAKAKGKSRASNSSGEFRVINASLVLSIPPVFASDLRAGVEEMLDSMVMR